MIQSGCLIVSVACKSGEGETKGEEEANAERHVCRAIPSNVGKVKPLPLPLVAKGKNISSLFDPLLQKCGSRLISPDTESLRLACLELGAMPFESLRSFMLRPGGRGGRAISGPRAVVSIVKEARQNWEAQGRTVAPAQRLCKCGAEIMFAQAGLCGSCAEREGLI